MPSGSYCCQVMLFDAEALLQVVGPGLAEGVQVRVGLDCAGQTAQQHLLAAHHQQVARLQREQAACARQVRL
ncbi:hypothetical protein BZ164_01465 [Pseudomonas veronii]|nr:hypothetical protein BZ164_01465 [Pseudomonas veronii]